MKRLLFKSRHNSAALFKPADATLYYVASAILLAIEFQWSARTRLLAFALWYRRLDAFLAEPLPNPVCIVGFVTGQCFGTLSRPPHFAGNADCIHGLLEEGRLVALSRADLGGQGQSLSIGNQVYFGRESASALPKGVILRFVRVPFLTSLLGAPPAARVA